ncbi:carotenoid oxygenase family protein [Legionella spiritensis]|uniref:Carotenoid cleavage oxygenase n=1 Tax=Legionella spiritensis TaxID=452 RepID=A0A0W0YYD5_LEGSP|nr:carotenoid oxygenase family protein [Legionella spiritensis]KTD61897.1 Carotenoid cleavage oxygenase [Legionella spiritensis]SNV31216.1 8'-apo-beta-carotenal 15,15'-oxygenase [Legionella spiritensis]
MPSTLQGFIPWITYAIVASFKNLNTELAPLAAIAATLLFCRSNLRKKFILDWSSLVYFILLSLLYLSPLKAWLDQYAYLISNIALGLIMWISIVIRQPFSMQYAKEEVDEIYWISPLFRQINYTISIVWASALTLMALDGLLQSLHIIKSSLAADAILVALMIIAIGFTKRFPDWYQGFLFRRFSRNKEDLSKNPFLQGNYAPVKDELFVEDLPVDGAIPPKLCGIYMRNGPNPAFDPISYTYPIDGDGMLHAIYIHDGKASYRNRFVETKGLNAEKKAGRALYGGISNPIPTDPKLVGKNGDPGPVKDGAFIHIIRHARQYLAMYESGPAYEVSAQLQTIGEWCPAGGERPFPVNAHTRLDPNTGELFAFTYNFTPPYLQYYVLDKTGQLTHNIPIEKPASSMAHDFILTQHYLVFFDCPAIFDFSRLQSGGHLLNWQPELGVTIIVVDRKTSEVSRIVTEPFFVYHFANGFEKDGKLVIDYVRHEQLAIGDTLLSKTPPHLYRTTIDPDKKTATHQQMDDRIVEFPRINDNLTSLPNRYVYMPTKTSAQNEAFHALIKYDLDKQTTLVHDFGKHAEIGEAVFVPDSSGKKEDDGWLALFLYDNKKQQSQFVLLDAKTLDDKPVASVTTPRRVPHGLHGSWFNGLW